MFRFPYTARGMSGKVDANGGCELT